jgi:hypothetical protein
MKIKAVIFDLFETLVDFFFNQNNQVLVSMTACGVSGRMDTHPGPIVRLTYRNYR